MTRAEHAARLAAAATSSDERQHYIVALQRAQFAEASARGAQWIDDTQRQDEYRMNVWRLSGYYR